MINNLMVLLIIGLIHLNRIYNYMKKIYINKMKK